MNRIFEIYQKEGLGLFNPEKPNDFPRTVCEVGVNHVHCCRVTEFINRGINTILVEPQIDLAREILNTFQEFDNIKVVNAAIADFNGKINLFKRYANDASAFIEAVPLPPMMHCDGYVRNQNDSVEVEAITMDKIDDGTIDILLVDAEGAEWFILKNLVSKPKLVGLELMGPNNYQPNFLKEIQEWLITNRYRQVDAFDSDIYFIRDE